MMPCACIARASRGMHVYSWATTLRKEIQTKNRVSDKNHGEGGDAGKRTGSGRT